MSLIEDLFPRAGKVLRAVATERDEERTEAPTAQAVDETLAAAIQAAVSGLLTAGPFLDEVANRIVDRLGLIPTAREIAAQVHELEADTRVPASADRPEGHPVNPEDALS